MSAEQSTAKKQSAHIRSYRGHWPEASREYLKQHPMCAGYKCSQRATHTDHIKPHGGDKRMFWDRRNWQPLCHNCHNKKTQAERVGKSAFDASGRPTDPDHFWNVGNK